MKRIIIACLSFILLNINQLRALNVHPTHEVSAERKLVYSMPYEKEEGGSQFFDSRQGLSNSCIHRIYEDSRHNIWICTQNGLNRYDGLSMNVYRHDERDENSLCHDETTALLQYDKNHVLIGTATGLDIFNYATDKFQHIPFIGIGGDTIKSRVIGLYKIIDRGKTRWMMTFSGYGNGEILRDENGNYSLRHITEFNTSDTNDNPVQFFQDSLRRLWIVNSRNNVYRKTGNSFKPYKEIDDVLKLSFSSTGKMYAITNNKGLYVYDKQSDKFRQVATSSDMGGVVYGLNPWTDGRMLICTDGGGLRIYNEQTGSVTESSIKVNDFNLGTSNVKDAICDSYNNVWIGIYWKGLMMRPSNQSSFEYIGRHSISKNTIGTNSVVYMTPGSDGNHLWVSVDNDGLYYITADGTSSIHYGRVNNPQAPSAFTAIYVIDQHKESLLLGTFTNGMWKLSNGNIIPATDRMNRIFDIQPATNACVWVASMGNGFYHYNPMTGNIVNYTNTSAPEQTSTFQSRHFECNPYVYCIMQNGSNLYVGTADGLNICHCDAKGNITTNPYKILQNYAIKHITLSADGKFLWVATDNGLVRIDGKNYSSQRYSIYDGLPNISVESIYADGNRLWVATDNGLSCFDTQSETFDNFTTDDGLQDNQFSRGAILAMNDNIYVGGISGLTYFNRESIHRDNVSLQLPRLKIVNLLVDGHTIHQGDLSGTREILKGVIDDEPCFSLSNTDNHFVLELCVEGLSNQHVTYEYSINGGEWISQGAHSSRLIFDNLSPSTYKIRLRAVSFNAVSPEREVTVTIRPAWYASWWAKLIYMLLSLLVCYLLYLYISRQIRAHRVIERHRQQQELNEARIQFFMNISHEIRTPMTLILSPLEHLINTDSDKERQRNYSIIRQNAGRIMRLINQMMDVRKIEQGKFLLKYNKVEMVSFLQSIFDVFASNAKSRNIDFEFVHDISSLIAYIDEENIDKVVMNLLSNAFKFTPDGGKITLNLSAADKDSHFMLSVTDSGVGIKDEDKPRVFQRFYSAGNKNGYIGTGIGLNLTQMLVKLHNGTITVSDNPQGQGTQFVIDMPIGKEENVQNTALPIIHEPTAIDNVQQTNNNSRRGNIVIVEDDESIRQYVNSELSSDLNINDFTNGQEAWDYILSSPDKVDLIISDIMMPVMDGLTLCQKVKSNINTNHIPIVLMTALGSDADRIVGITNGADAYVTKPFNIDVLRSMVINLMNTRHMLHGRFQSEKLKEEKIDEIQLESPDENLMRRVLKVINENMDNSELSIEQISDMVGISRVHLYRRMKDLTGQSPSEFIRYVRLKEAARLLSQKKTDITGVSIATGFKSASSFSTSFKSLYGVSPTEYMKRRSSCSASESNQ